MVTLSGILDFSMGNFLCLRGYTSYKKLSRISEKNPDVQRELIEQHKGEMANFLNHGEYRFFPEVILSVSLESNGNHAEVNTFFEAMRTNAEWGNQSLGKFQMSVFRHTSGEKNKLVHITFDKFSTKLNRIDGNHRLSAADNVGDDFKVPFCLILCRNAEEEKQYSRAIFHNINAKQIPLKLEENLKVILSNPDVFPDSKLISDPSFGWKYYLARKTIESIDFIYFPAIATYINNAKYSFFVDLYGFLLECESIEANNEAVNIVKAQLAIIDRALIESNIAVTTTNIAVIGALAYYRITNEAKYRGFLSWVKKNNIGSVENLHINDVINLYDEIYEHVPKKVFLARWYPADTDPEYNNSVHRINALKEVITELGLDLTDLGTRDTGTFDIREVMYRDIRDCDIFIADLTGARHNVMVEVGYALKHIDTGRMLFYFQETKDCPKVPFDVNHFSYDQIFDSAEIKEKTKARIQTILNQSQCCDI